MNILYSQTLHKNKHLFLPFNIKPHEVQHYLGMNISPLSWMPLLMCTYRLLGSQKAKRQTIAAEQPKELGPVVFERSKMLTPLSRSKFIPDSTHNCTKSTLIDNTSKVSALKRTLSRRQTKVQALGTMQSFDNLKLIHLIPLGSWWLRSNAVKWIRIHSGKWWYRYPFFSSTQRYQHFPWINRPRCSGILWHRFSTGYTIVFFVGLAMLP